MAIPPFPPQFDLNVKHAKIDEQLHVMQSANVHGELNVAGPADLAGGLTVNEVRFPLAGANASQWPGLRAGAPEQLDLLGGLRVGAKLAVGGDLSITGQTTLGGDTQVTGNLRATGIVDAAALHQNGQPFVGSNWEKIAGDIHYTQGNVGIGASTPAPYKLKVEGGDTYLSGALTVDGAVRLAATLTPTDLIWENNGAAIHYGNRGLLGATPTFNPDNDTPGLWIEGSSDGESGGLFMNGSTICLWSPGDNDLLRVYDEDDFSSPRFVLNGSGSVGIGTPAPQGALDVRGDIRAGNSDLYFTKTDHAHTGIGNTAGWAAIENAADYNALMILGRAGTSKGRNVRLWDYLQVNGSMDITGNLGVGINAPSHRFHVLAPDAVGLFESSGTQAYLRLSTREGLDNRVEITNRPGGRLTLWTAGGGDAFSIARDGQIFLGNNKSGPFVRLNDDVWLSDPQNGTIHVRNGNNSNWGQLVGIFNNVSSRAQKKDIAVLPEVALNQLLEDTLRTKVVTYRYKGDDAAHRLRLGVIAEESPAYVVGDDGESLSTVEYIAMLHGAIKALAHQVQTYTRVESRVTETHTIATDKP